MWVSGGMRLVFVGCEAKEAQGGVATCVSDCWHVPHLRHEKPGWRPRVMEGTLLCLVLCIVLHTVFMFNPEHPHLTP